MQHTNDDIDELFRNAADNYPLKINGADWEGVADRLQGEENAPPMTGGGRTSGFNKNYKYFLLLLLVPLAFLTGKYVGSNGKDNNATTASANSSKIPPAVQQSQAGAAKANDAGAAPGNNNGVLDKSQTEPGRAAGNKQSIVSNTRQATGAAVIKQAMVGNTANNVIKENGSHLPGLGDLKAAEKQYNGENVLRVQDKTPQLSNKVVNPAGATKEESPKDMVAANTEVKPGIEKDQPVQNAMSVVKAKEKDKIEEPVHIARQKRFYIGAFIAPDYTTVKYQPGNKIGFDYGGLVGYNFSKSLSVEFGISTDKKYYTTDGKYYNSKENWLTNSGKLLTLSGYSSLTEFPLNLKYNFKPNKDGNFFVAAGLVSYVVHEEHYDYEFDKLGYIYHKERSTKNSTTNMFANFNISAGYESSLSNTLNFRVEPYYRVPVKGIGQGSLPITSIGLNIGVTKKIR